MQIRQLLRPVHYWEIRETGQREIEFLVDWVHFIHCGSSTSLHIRGNPTEQLFHIFVFLEQRVKYSECWLEVLLNDICKKTNKQTNKKAQSLTRKFTGLSWLFTSRSSAWANGTQNSGLVKFGSESRLPFVHTSWTVNHLLKLPGTSISDGFEEMEHKLPFGMERFSYDLKKWFR